MSAADWYLWSCILIFNKSSELVTSPFYFFSFSLLQVWHIFVFKPFINGGSEVKHKMSCKVDLWWNSFPLKGTDLSSPTVFWRGIYQFWLTVFGVMFLTVKWGGVGWWKTKREIKVRRKEEEKKREERRSGSMHQEIIIFRNSETKILAKRLENSLMQE